MSQRSATRFLHVPFSNIGQSAQLRPSISLSLGSLTAAFPPYRQSRRTVHYTPHTPYTPPSRKLPSAPSPPTLSPTDLAIYTHSNAPTQDQLQFAAKYFKEPSNRLSPIFKFRNFPLSEVPEVTVLGRSNVGKSSLLNTLLGIPHKSKNTQRVASVSKKPGHTVSMNAIGLAGTTYSVKQKLWYGKRGLVLVDMPGYGHGSRDEWGAEITKYLAKREQLGMRFLLIDAMAGVQEKDRQILEILVEQNLPYTLILSKVDRLVEHKRGAGERLKHRMAEVQAQVAKVQNELRGGMFHAPAILGCSVLLPCGLDAVRWAMLESTHSWNEKQERALLNP